MRGHRAARVLLAVAVSASGLTATAAPVGGGSAEVGGSAELSVAVRVPTATGPPGSTTGSPRLRAVIRTTSAGRLGDSYRKGCPVKPHSLRRIALNHWGFDDTVHRGRLVVQADEVTEVKRVFRRLLERQFAIRRMRPAAAYDNSMRASDRDNNTMAFSCKRADDKSWTAPSYGRVIRINPVRNPRVHRGTVSPAKGRRFLDRRNVRRGMLVGDDAAVRAFAGRGWDWRGDRDTWRDYGQFRRPGPPKLQPRVHRVTARMVRYTYRPGCPVPPSKLRRITLRYWGYDNDVHHGELVVRRDTVYDLKQVFRSALRQRFPLHKLRRADKYDGNDEAAMADDNTSAFNCRKVTGNPYRLSQHSYGNAIDINTFTNPYVTSSQVYPPGSDRFLDRRPYRTGMILRDGPIARGFKARDWPWGARWPNPDYQHFSSNGG